MEHQTYYEGMLNIVEEKQRIYEETVAELQREERYQNYFADYSEDSVKNFIEYYAKQKSTWLTGGEKIVSYIRQQALQWRQYAFLMLEHIQQKKLFNLECEWRAEKMKLDGIEISIDFFVWSRHVLDCRLVTPVSEEDLQLYISFIRELTDEKSFDDFNIKNDYLNLKEGYFKRGEYYEDYPAWFAYYDAHYGTDALLYLPDIRGEKEEIYIQLWRDEMQPVWQAHHKERDMRKPIQSLYERDFAEWFLKEFDTRETLSLYHHSRQWDDKNQRIEDIDMDLINLQEADREVAMEDDSDWRKGIKRAAERYYRERTLEVLPEIWKTYLERVEKGEPAVKEEDYHIKSQTGFNLRNDVMQHILRGRELKGEPRDLNF